MAEAGFILAVLSPLIGLLVFAIFWRLAQT
jgi:hypothetical protein